MIDCTHDPPQQVYYQDGYYQCQEKKAMGQRQKRSEARKLGHTQELTLSQENRLQKKYSERQNDDKFKWLSVIAQIQILASRLYPG